MSLALCTLAMAVPVHASAATAVSIPDPVLRQTIASTLVQNDSSRSTSVITDEDMQSIASLGIGRVGVRDIRGLEYATNLKFLTISGDGIRSLAPLAGLTKMQYLWVDSTSVSDLTPLAGMTGLSNLWIDSSEVTTLTPLAGLTGLQSLWLDHNRIADLAPISALPNLTSLRLEDNRIRDVSPLLQVTRPLTVSLGKNYLDVGTGSPARIALATMTNNGTTVSYTGQHVVSVVTTATVSAPPAASVNASLTLQGAVIPAWAPGKVALQLSRYDGRAWRSMGVATAEVVQGRYSYAFKPRYRGSWRLVAAYTGGRASTTRYRSSKRVAALIKVN